MITIEPEKNIINFWLGNKFAKEKNIQSIRKQLNIVSDKDFGRTDPHIIDVDIPETIDIDYEELQKFKCARNGGRVKKFKDGVLVFCDENVKTLQTLTISYYRNENTNTPLQHFISVNNSTEFFLDPRDTEYYDSIKRDLNLYVAYKKGYKNKVFHFNLKNNEAVITGIDRLKNFVNTDDVKKNHLSSLEAFLDEDHIDRFVESLGVLDKFESVKDAMSGNMIGADEYEKHEREKVVETSLELLNKKITRNDVLKAGYEVYIVNKLIGLCSVTEHVIRESSEEHLQKIREHYPICEKIGFDKNILEKPLNILSNIKDFIKANLEFSFEEMKPFLKKVQKKLLDHRRENAGEKVNINIHDILNECFCLLVLYKDTNLGTVLPGIGEVNTENKSYMDCFIYWNKLRFLNLLYNNIEPFDFPMILKNGQIYNDLPLHEEIYDASKDLVNLKTLLDTPNESCDVINQETSNKIKETLKQAFDSQSGLLIPYNACVEIPDDFVFKYARFIESKDYITVFLHDENDRYTTEIFVKNEEDFRYWLFNEHELIKQQSEGSIGNLYLKLASCIRDWKILIERDSTMTCRGYKVPKGVKTTRKRWFYLPRVRYNRKNSDEQSRREKIFFNESRKFSGERVEHRRKLPAGMKPSKAQIALAESRGMYLPDGYTYVRPSVWGKIKKSTREIEYRTKSLHGLLFSNLEDEKIAKEFVEMGPAGFEEYCEKHIESLGYSILDRNNYDGGIDVRGIKDNKDGSVTRLFAQCKHYLESGNPIGPDVVRELQGSVELEVKDLDLQDCHIEKMVMTTTRYTHKAVEAAEKLDIKLITTDDMK